MLVDRLMSEQWSIRNLEPCYGNLLLQLEDHDDIHGLLALIFSSSLSCPLISDRAYKAMMIARR